MTKRLCTSLKAVNLLHVVDTNCGVDSMTLVRLYRFLVRSKLDHGCIEYGSAHDSYLQTLDGVENASLRVCLRAVKMTVI
jgi:hypothetical protein